jgi:hypothetical protein
VKTYRFEYTITRVVDFEASSDKEASEMLPKEIENELNYCNIDFVAVAADAEELEDE